MPEMFRKTIFTTAGLVMAGGLAWLTTALQQAWSPVLILPILVGGLLGIGLIQLSRRWLPSTPCYLLTVAVISGMANSAGVHVAAYGKYRAAYEQTRLKNPQVQLIEHAFQRLEPMSFSEFMTYSARERVVGSWRLRGWQVWLSWAFDAALVLAAAVGVICTQIRQSPATVTD